MADVAEDANLSKEDYASVTITIDHLNDAARDDGHVVTKMVFATQTAQEALMAQIEYFGEMGLMRRSSVIAKAHAISQKAAVISYEVGSRGITNVIADQKLWSAAISDGRIGGDGTVMGAVRTLVELAASLRKDAKKRGDTDPVQVFISGDDV